MERTIILRGLQCPLKGRTMAAGIVCAIVGAAQFYLLKRLIRCALQSEHGAVWFMLAKLALYALAAALVLTMLRSQLMGAGIGLAVGLIGSAVLSSIYTLLTGKGA